MIADLLVVGAGPAGCAAAMAARRAAPSLRVVVVDAVRFPRDKLCGGALTGGGLREMTLAGLLLRVPRVAVRHAVLRVEGNSLRVPLHRPAAVVRRREWDADLVAQVRAAGAEVLEEAPLGSLPRSGEGWVAGVGPVEVRFGLAVAADGTAGPSRALLGLPPGRRAPLRELAVEGAAQEDSVFDLDAGVAGYAWRFPSPAGVLAGSESVGIYSMESTHDLSDRLLRWMGAERLVLEAAGARPGAWAIRVFEAEAPAGSGPVLLAGDALGVDPLAGEGLRYALWSGRLAGEVAARALAAGAGPRAARLVRLAYRARLAATRSGVVLALAAGFADRLHRSPRGSRWRRMAADRRVAEAFAALVSGAAPVAPLVRLAARYRSLGGGEP